MAFEFERFVDVVDVDVVVVFLSYLHVFKQIFFLHVLYNLI